MSEHLAQAAPSLSPRQARMVERYREGLSGKHPSATPDYWRGMLEGYRAAVLTLYEDADQFFQTDPQAAQVTLLSLAIEELTR